MSEDKITMKELKKHAPQPPLEGVVYRKYDSDDIVRIRGASVLTEADGGKTKIDIGALQKASICLGVKSCPWFGDVVQEEQGVTQEIYNRRTGLEFRRIPIEVVDQLFKEAQELNKTDFSKDLKKG